VVNFNFVGQSRLATFAKKERNSKEMWEPNAAKAHIGVTSALGGFAGYQAGKSSSMFKGIRENNMKKALGAGGYKSKLAGALIGGGALGTIAYLTHKANPQSPIGKSRIFKQRDMDGRSDKGKKRKY
jgi:hypothetical protein